MIFTLDDPDKTSMHSDLSDQHYFCNYEENQNSGKYNTITRMDETNLDILSKKVNIDYNSITECKGNESMTPGLTCGKSCILN